MVGVVGIPYSEHVLTLLVTSGMYVVGTYFLSLRNRPFLFSSHWDARETRKKSPTKADFGKEVGR